MQAPHHRSDFSLREHTSLEAAAHGADLHRRKWKKLCGAVPAFVEPKAQSHHSDRPTEKKKAHSVDRELKFTERGPFLPAILGRVHARDELWMELSAAGMHVSYMRHDGAGACRRGNAYRGSTDENTSMEESNA